MLNIIIWNILNHLIYATGGVFLGLRRDGAVILLMTAKYGNDFIYIIFLRLN